MNNQKQFWVREIQIKVKRDQVGLKGLTTETKLKQVISKVIE